MEGKDVDIREVVEHPLSRQKAKVRTDLESVRRRIHLK